MALHTIYFSKGAQALVTVPHRGGAPVRVTAGTFEIVDTRYSVDSDEHVIVAAGTAASIDALSTTLTAKAGRNAADRRALTLTSTAGLVVGAQYLLEAASGQTELVRIAAVPSGTLARTTQELRGDFATGAALRGVQVSATFPAPPAADEDNLDDGAFMVIWTFAGLPPLRESIHIERGEEAQLATLDDLRELDPMLSIGGGDRIDPAAALARAHKDFRLDLQMAGVIEADLLAGALGRDAVCYRAAFLATQHGDDPVSERKAASYLARYQEIRAAVVVGALKPGVVALDKDQAARATNPATLFHGWGFGPGAA
jgi:hypothetical protein